MAWMWMMWIGMAWAEEPADPGPEPTEDLPISPFVPTGIVGGILGSTAGTLAVLGVHTNRDCESPCADGLPVGWLAAGFGVGGLAGMGGGLVLGRASTGKRGPAAVALGAGIGVAGLVSLGVSVAEVPNDWIWRGAGVGAVFAVGPLLGLAVSGEQRTPRGERLQTTAWLAPDVTRDRTGVVVQGVW